MKQKPSKIEINRAFALFMGATLLQDYSTNSEQSGIGVYFKDSSSPGPYRDMPLDCLKYHSSPDWFMPVIEKIESLGFAVNIVKSKVDISRDMPLFAKNLEDVAAFGSPVSVESKNESIILAAYGFIEWWNREGQEISLEKILK